MSSYLTIYGVPKNEGKPIDIVSFSRSHCIYSAICDEVNVAWAGGMYHIELVRPVTREEIEEDNSRWWGYEIGSNTNAFHSPEDVIALAKEVCKARFKGNWILKIVDYSGKDLDEEILIDKL